jgi:hypothetical protein
MNRPDKKHTRRRDQGERQCNPSLNR